MRKMKDVVKTEQEIADVFCDMCGISCMVPYTNEPNSLKHFVGIHIQQPWGFLSNKDLELWEADICEKCADEKLATIIDFKKSNFIRGRMF
jgi:hypothetical protein